MISAPSQTMPKPILPIADTETASHLNVPIGKLKNTTYSTHTHQGRAKKEGMSGRSASGNRGEVQLNLA